MPRHDFDVQAMSAGDVYRLLSAIVVPRPIAWVSTRSAAGIDNLAPHSFFTIASDSPPVVQFTSVGVKDTLRNIVATREFVIHLGSEALMEQINLTGIDAPEGVSEFDLAGLDREPSIHVVPSRVAQSPVAIECRLRRLVEVGRCTLVLGDVVHVAVDESVLDLADPARPHPDVQLLRPVARLGRDEWATLGEVSRRARPAWRTENRWPQASQAPTVDV